MQTPPATPAEVVYETVKYNLSVLSQGGGYIFAGVHNMPGDTPVEHIAAVLQAYRDCRPCVRPYRLTFARGGGARIMGARSRGARQLPRVAALRGYRRGYATTQHSAHYQRPAAL